MGHIGGDDFIFIVPSTKISAVCGEILERVRTLIPFQYNDQDRRAGYFFGKDRRGQLHRVPLMTLSIGIVTNRNRRFTHPAQVSELATEMKSYAKTLPGSVFVVDRRRSDRQESPGLPIDAERLRTRHERDLSELQHRLSGRPGQGPGGGEYARGAGCGAFRGSAPGPSRGPSRRLQTGMRAAPPPVAAPPRPRPAGAGRPATADRPTTARRHRRPTPPVALRPAARVRRPGRRGLPPSFDRGPAGSAPPSTGQHLAGRTGGLRAASDSRPAGKTAASPPRAGGRSIPSCPRTPPEGPSAGPGADLGHGRLLSCQAPGRLAKGQPERGVRGGDQEELGGVRGSGRTGDCQSTGYFRDALNEILAGGRQISEGGQAEGADARAEDLPVRPSVRLPAFILLCIPRGRSTHMADLTDRLTDLQHRITELRDFL